MGVVESGPRGLTLRIHVIHLGDVVALHHRGLSDELTQFIKNQKIFFVSTAPNQGHINLSPKGVDSFRVLSPTEVAWLNLTGSGNETAAHVLENGRMTVMFCSFEGKPLILRLYGSAQVVHMQDSRWSEVARHFDVLPGSRQIFLLAVELVQTSCGFGVPNFSYEGERDQLHTWAEKRGDEGVRQYWQDKNVTSLDGLPTGIFDPPRPDPKTPIHPGSGLAVPQGRTPAQLWNERFKTPGHAYGWEPNDFLASVVDKLPRGRALCLAEGEGRNALFLASRGWEVIAVDQAEVGMVNARDRAASLNLPLTTHVADLADFDMGVEQFDVVVSIWCHLPQPLRRLVHARAVASLKPGGAMVLEAYTPQQLELKTGGPPVVDLLMQISALRQEFEGLHFEIGQEIERVIHEGALHNGRSAVVQILAFK